MSYNSGVHPDDCSDHRGSGHVHAMVETVVRGLGARSVQEAVSRIDGFLKESGCPCSLSEVGVGKDDVEFLVQSVNLDRLANNPRQVTGDALRGLLLQAL